MYVHLHILVSFVAIVSVEKSLEMDNYLFEGGRITKMEVDYSPACDEKIPLAKDMAKKNPEAFHDALELLMQLEKQTRLVCKRFEHYLLVYVYSVH